MKKTERQMIVAQLAQALCEAVDGDVSGKVANIDAVSEVQVIAGWGLGFEVTVDGEQYRVSIAAKRSAKVEAAAEVAKVA